MGSNSEIDNQEALKKVFKYKKDEEMTHGVEIFKYVNPKNNTVLTIWDFAGFFNLFLFSF